MSQGCIGDYEYDTRAAGEAAIWKGRGTEPPDMSSSQMVVGSSEWIWLGDDMAKRLCALLSLFEEVSTDDLVEAVEIDMAGQVSSQFNELMQR